MTAQPRVAPAAERNKAPIAQVLEGLLPPEGQALEIASGFGQHVTFLAERFPRWTFTPSDIAREHVEEIDLRRTFDKLANVREALHLNAESYPWPVEPLDLVLNINMIHISPWSSGVGLFRGAGEALRVGGYLFVYGPFRVDGAHTAQSNRAFDKRLRAMDPRFGIRDVDELRREAESHRLHLRERVPMPANNFSLVFERMK